MPNSHELKVEDVTDLYEMLSYKRPHDTKGETLFTDKFIVPLGAVRDDYGNLIKEVGEGGPILWSCHVDTVHHKEGRQNVVRDDKYVIRLKKNSDSNCLGADDTAGVWLMKQLIQAEVPGLYIFHRGEEVGCLGSKALVKETPKIVDKIKYVIALDRMGTDSIITFQRGQRCCSEAFSEALAKQLPEYKSDPGGMYTDSAQYTDLVGECTNLSVGYYGQHSKSERLDLAHLAKLRTSLIRLDASKLVSARKPGTTEYRYQSHWHGGGHAYGESGFNVEEWRSDYYADAYKGGRFVNGVWRSCTYQEWEKWRTQVKMNRALPAPKATEYDKILKLIKDYPMRTADMLHDWGFTAEELSKAIWEAPATRAQQ